MISPESHRGSLFWVIPGLDSGSRIAETLSQYLSEPIQLACRQIQCLRPQELLAACASLKTCGYVDFFGLGRGRLWGTFYRWSGDGALSGRWLEGL